MILEAGLSVGQIAAYTAAIGTIMTGAATLIVAVRTGRIEKDITTPNGAPPIGDVVEHISQQVTTIHSLTMAQIAEQTRSEQINRKLAAGIPLSEEDTEHLRSMKDAGRS